jgi:RNA polymerase sigma-70 factor (ECF subfamily)
MLESSDEALFDKYRTGDRTALARLVRRYQVPLYNFALRQVRSGSGAEDLVQETFRRVVQHANHFERAAPFKAWIYAIARNLSLDVLRSRESRQHRSLDDPDMVPAEAALADPNASVERAAVSAEIRGRVLAAIDLLPDEQREVFLLREVCDLRFAEIAKVVNESENTVKSRMRYALERLQVALGDFEAYARELG